MHIASFSNEFICILLWVTSTVHRLFSPIQQVWVFSFFNYYYSKQPENQHQKSKVLNKSFNVRLIIKCLDWFALRFALLILRRKNQPISKKTFKYIYNISK